jgi:hypothetical protein
MTSRAPKRKRPGPDPVQDRRPPANGGMSGPETRESTGGRPKVASASPRDRRAGRQGGGFSAEAVPLRPPAERSAEREREERLRVMTSRRRPRLRNLPGGRVTRNFAIALVAVTLVAVGSVAIVDRGGGVRRAPVAGADLSARAAGDDRRPQGLASNAKPQFHAGPRVGDATVVEPHPTVRVRRMPSDRARPRHHRTPHRDRPHRPARPRANTGSAPVAMTAASPEEPTPSPAVEPAPEPPPAPEPAPVVEAAPEPPNAAEPPQQAPSPKEESPQAQEPTSVERQFGFEE